MSDINTWITAEQLEFLKEHRFDGSWEDVAKDFNRQFKEKRTTDAVRLAFGRYKDTDLTGEDFSWWTRGAFEASTEFKHQKGRFFVTGVMPLHSINKDGYTYTYNHVNMNAFRTLLNEFNTNEQRPVLLPMKAHTLPLEKSPSIYDPALTPWKEWFTAEAEFNQNLRAIDMRINPQQIQPLTAMEHADFDSSVIIASPRQHLEIIATGNSTHPRLMLSTGVLNFPGYQPNRIGRLAEKAHKMGGIIVEVDGNVFHQRKVMFDMDGGYYDLNTYHHFDGNTKVRVEALIFGDIHFGQGNPELQKAAVELIQLLQPRNLIFHDAFDALCINHHVNMVDKILRPSWARDLQTEAAAVRKLMNELKDAAPADCKIYWVDSNHNDFLSRYLKNKSYFNDEANFKLAHELQLVLLNGGNPVAHLLNLPYINYLGQNDDLFIKGIQCANHGHSGVNGARGTRATVGKSAPKLVTGHTHTPFEKGEHTGLGMWTNPRHGYNNGASTWLPSAGIIHADGSRQQIIGIRKPGTQSKYLYRLED